MDKKIIITILAILLLFVLTGCRQSATPAAETAQTVSETSQANPETTQDAQDDEDEIEVSQEQDKEEPRFAEIIQIGPQEAYEMLEQDASVFLLDVRSQEEYDEAHVEGSILIPVNELEGRLDEVPSDQKILIICRSGSRSMNAANILVQNGYDQVYNIRGGILAWIDAGLPVIR